MSVCHKLQVVMSRDMAHAADEDDDHHLANYVENSGRHAHTYYKSSELLKDQSWKMLAGRDAVG